ncbi:MAG: flippase [Candidatus Hadarchaeales archaeon]
MSEERDYARRFVRGTVMVFLGLIAAGFIAFLVRVFLARTLHDEAYGVFYTAIALVSFFGLFRDLGLGLALTKLVSEFQVHERFDEIKSSMLLTIVFSASLSLGIALTIYFLSGTIASSFFFKNPAIPPAPVLRILSIWFFLSIFYLVFQSTFVGLQDMRARALIEFLSVSLILVFSVIFVWALGLGVRGAAYAYVAAALVMGGMTFLLLRMWYPRVLRAHSTLSWELGRRLFAFALPVFVGGIGALVLGYTDILMIAAFRTPVEVGFYQVALPTAQVLSPISLSLTTVLFPMISELWTRGKRKLAGKALYFLIKFSFILILPLAFVLIAFPEIVIRLLFGVEYLPGAAALRILAGAAIVSTLSGILATAMAGIGKPIINTEVTGIMAGFNPIGNLLLIPIYGIEGAAIATFFSHLLGLGLLLYYTREIMGLTPPALSLLKTAVGGILTLFLVFGLKSFLVMSAWLEAFVVMMLSLAFYAIWILTTKAVSRNDLVLIKRITPMPKWLLRAVGRFVGK